MITDVEAPLGISQNPLSRFIPINSVGLRSKAVVAWQARTLAQHEHARQSGSPGISILFRTDRGMVLTGVPSDWVYEEGSKRAQSRTSGAKRKKASEVATAVKLLASPPSSSNQDNPISRKRDHKAEYAKRKSNLQDASLKPADTSSIDPSNEPHKKRKIEKSERPKKADNQIKTEKAAIADMQITHKAPVSSDSSQAKSNASTDPDDRNAWIALQQQKSFHRRFSGLNIDQALIKIGFEQQAVDAARQYFVIISQLRRHCLMQHPNDATMQAHTLQQELQARIIADATPPGPIFQTAMRLQTVPNVQTLYLGLEMLAQEWVLMQENQAMSSVSTTDTNQSTAPIEQVSVDEVQQPEPVVEPKSLLIESEAAVAQSNETGGCDEAADSTGDTVAFTVPEISDIIHPEQIPATSSSEESAQDSPTDSLVPMTSTPVVQNSVVEPASTTIESVVTDSATLSTSVSLAIASSVTEPSESVALSDSNTASEINQSAELVDVISQPMEVDVQAVKFESLEEMVIDANEAPTSAASLLPDPPNELIDMLRARHFVASSPSRSSAKRLSTKMVSSKVEADVSVAPLSTEIAVSDHRQCLFCSGPEGSSIIDSQPGRLVPLEAGTFAHIQCMLWSSEVYESSSVVGALDAGVVGARHRALSTVRCDLILIFCFSELSISICFCDRNARFAT
jgi:hypothetical protein